MFPHRSGLAVRLRSLARGVAFIAALSALLVFAASVGAASPAPTGTITTGPATGATTVYPGYGYGYGYGYATTYIAPSFIPPGTYNGISCGGVYGCPLALPAFGYGTTYVQGNLYCGWYTCGIAQPIQR
jgi:hypothetical protein